MRSRLARGCAALGVLPAGLDPQVVLPAPMRSLVALTYRASVTETSDEIVDLLLLGGEERRAFVSYAHSDGGALAQQVFEALAERRFDVYLDRFRTPPSADFVERIDDELRDKAMVVVVETPGAIASTWVLQEILTAKYRRFGLLALNIGEQQPHRAGVGPDVRRTGALRPRHGAARRLLARVSIHRAPQSKLQPALVTGLDQRLGPTTEVISTRNA